VPPLRLQRQRRPPTKLLLTPGRQRSQQREGRNEWQEGAQKGGRAESNGKEGAEDGPPVGLRARSRGKGYLPLPHPFPCGRQQVSPELSERSPPEGVGC